MATTFGFDKKTMKTLDELKTELGASSKVEVLRKAIALLKLAQEAQSRGGEIILGEPDGTKKQIVLS